MYKWVQEPGVVARFTKGGKGKLIFNLIFSTEYYDK